MIRESREFSAYLKWVHEIRINPAQVSHLLDQLPLYTFGGNSIILGLEIDKNNSSFSLQPPTKDTEINLLVRIPFFSLIGKNEMLRLLEKHKGYSEYFPFSQLELIRGYSKRDYLSRARKVARELIVRVASANANYITDPRSTIPINSIIVLENTQYPIATIEKRIDGTHPNDSSDLEPYYDIMVKMGSEAVIRNILFNVSPYIGPDGITRYLHAFHVIDFEQMPH